MTADIIKIKQSGKLIAISTSWQYWLLDNILYSVNVEGTTLCVWCGLNRLEAHLHRLWQITGKRFFTEGTDVTVIDKDFVARYNFA